MNKKRNNFWQLIAIWRKYKYTRKEGNIQILVSMLRPISNPEFSPLWNSQDDPSGPPGGHTKYFRSYFTKYNIGCTYWKLFGPPYRYYWTDPCVSDNFRNPLHGLSNSWHGGHYDNHFDFWFCDNPWNHQLIMIPLVLWFGIQQSDSLLKFPFPLALTVVLGKFGGWATSHQQVSERSCSYCQHTECWPSK